MQLLRHFTIRRIVLWIMIISLSLVAVVVTHSFLTIRDIYRHLDQTNVVTQQLTFLVHSSLNMQDSTAEDATLHTSIPVGPVWDGYRSALSDKAHFPTAARELLETLKRQRAFDDETVMAERHRLEFVLISALVAAIALLMFCDRYLIIHLVRPVEKIRAHLKTIETGDLTREPENLGRNCIGQLVPLVTGMQHSLLDAVVAIRDNAQILHGQAGDIAAGNEDLSDRTSTQAAALEQTAASMDEITATVSHNAENAREARELACRTAVTTQQSTELVKNLVVAMGSIAEGSEKIRNFTATINNISFQTNILALNAAVEAARAGEQGRGFAVVASEVRSLAQRSAAASKEIEGLITDSVLRISDGMRVADSAGCAMNEVLHGVDGVNKLIGQIAQASEEQSKGIAQVTQAVAELDRVTQQNAMLVQEVSATARSLNERTTGLDGAIARFTLPAEYDYLDNKVSAPLISLR